MNYLTKALEVNPQTCEFKYDLEKWTQVRHFPANFDISASADKFEGQELYGVASHKQTWSKDGIP
jgi:hypothetical protein